jgi:hypothetical protein
MLMGRLVDRAGGGVVEAKRTTKPRLPNGTLEIDEPPTRRDPAATHDSKSCLVVRLSGWFSRTV